MPTFFEIPTSPSPQTFSIQLAGVNYNFRLTYHGFNAEAGVSVGESSDANSIIDPNNLSSWILDIFDSSNNPIACGLPLIPGIDLLYQYQYLDIGGSIVVSNDSDPTGVPDFEGLGSTGHLWFVTFP